MPIGLTRVDRRPGTRADETGVVPVRGYVPHLDGLRALAVASVLAHHYVPVPALELGILATGGVRLFFVRSGFLITRILLAAPGEGSVISAVGFCARRALRIVPLALAAGLGPQPWAIAAVLTTAGTVAVAAVSWHCFESPINALKRWC